MMTDTLGPGRELDALVAEKVMGWTVNRTEKPRHWHTVGPTGRERDIQVGASCCAGQHYDDRAFMPSQSTVSAMDVVDTLEKRGWWVELTRRSYSTGAEYIQTGWSCDFRQVIPVSALSVYVEAPTRELAICLAALAVADKSTEFSVLGRKEEGA